MSDDNSPNDYVGNHLFNGRGSNQNNHGGQNPNCGGGDRGGGHFASVQCQICYKFGHGAWYCYHRLEENCIPNLPPPAYLAPAIM